MTRARQAEKMPVPALWMNPVLGMKVECSLIVSRSNRSTEGRPAPGYIPSLETDHRYKSARCGRFNAVANPAGSTEIDARVQIWQRLNS
jgi:hypothetical protein